MAERELIDASGHLAGKIYVQSDGTEELYDKNGQFKGRYFPQNNETIDAGGHLVGKGNFLSSLL